MERRRELNAILVWRLDRWGRSRADLITRLQELNTLRVGLVSLTGALDMTTPTWRAMAGLVAVGAEFSRDLLLERVKAGVAQARQQGSHRDVRVPSPTRNRASTPFSPRE